MWPLSGILFVSAQTDGVMVFVWKYCVRPLGGVWNVYELLPAFIVAMVVLIAVSLATGEPSKEIQDEFDEIVTFRG